MCDSHCFRLESAGDFLASSRPGLRTADRGPRTAAHGRLTGRL